MNYLDIFKKAYKIISSPAKAWEDISLNWDTQRVIVDFVYPFIGFCGLAQLVKSLIAYGWSSPQSFQHAMIDCCGIAIALFGGFFLAAYLINMISTHLFRLRDNLPRVEQFTGYSMVVIFVVFFFVAIFPEWKELGGILQLYVFYIVYKGAPVMLEIDENKRLGFSALAALAIIISPDVIYEVFNNLVHLLN